ncbi:MAG: hypothetical protein EBV86_14830 [Marivivens sp.]|nr:hypothetical protein [Marivivens sp.]NCW69803.1 hypothetical protein [Marivivens sp.]
MPEIPEIGIGAVGVPSIGARRVIPPPTLPPEPPVTLILGFPVADMPGGEIPHYEALDFTPGQHTHQATKPPNPGDEEKPAESKQPVSAPSPAVPLAADVPKVDKELPCPPADAIPLGAKNKSQTAVIIGYEMVDGTCEPQLKPLDLPAIIGNYLPAAPLVTTTATVAAVATTAAIFVRPLGDFMLKAIKPAVKKTIKKIKEKMGKKVAVESVWERRKFQRSLRK